VDRCGQEVRYVIDFYYFDDKAGTPEVGGEEWMVSGERGHAIVKSTKGSSRLLAADSTTYRRKREAAGQRASRGPSLTLALARL
jgi:hypothetical protein